MTTSTVLCDGVLYIGEEPAVPCEEVLYIGEEPAVNRARTNRWRLTAWVALAGVVGAATLVLAVGIRHWHRESQRQQCFEHLKCLGRAMDVYNQKLGHFPAPAIFDGDGKPLLSWRVALLPHPGYQSLYERFRLDEPWDSSHNRALLHQMPAEFACPGGPGRRAGRTTYMVIVGPENDAYSVNTAFEPTRGADIRHFTDGISNTILVLESDSSVPWTKPDDLSWVKGGPLPGLTSPHAGGTHALFADGATKFLMQTVRPDVLLGIITMNGGEVIGGG
jgi:prepilin-type processing-associated H-X9-DG protein